MSRPVKLACAMTLLMLIAAPEAHAYYSGGSIWLTGT